MKKIIIIFIITLLYSNLSAQSTTASTNAPPGGNVNNRYIGWSNSVIPLWFKTNNIVRARLNNQSTAGINGVTNHDVTGFFGIGLNGYFANNTPMSMLHIEGSNNTASYSGGGWRKWMQTGVFMKENSDAMYVGLRTVPNTTNRSDAVINWSDDATNEFGPDRLKIVFTSYSTGNGNNSDSKDGSSLLGYEFMQFAPSNYQLNSLNFPAGFIGIGPMFETTRPQSRLHINSEEKLETWFQISNQDGTGQLATDGFRLGILSDGTANFRQQENKPIIFYTDWDNNSGGVTYGERIRVTAVGEFNVPNPNNVFQENTTRVSICHKGDKPIYQPRSLLHLGYNTGSSSNNGPDGWRPWMDIGMFVSDGTDNVYLGLKKTTVTDRTDAVLSWGDNQPAQTPDGPDNLLFVFTATNSAIVPSTGQATTPNGVESMRMTPTQSGVFVGVGGNPGTNNYFNNSENPTQTFEINSLLPDGPLASGLRFTNLNSSVSPLPNNPNSGFLTVNSDGDVVYMAQNTSSVIGNFDARNGCSMANNFVELGQMPLIHDTKIPLDNFNLEFIDSPIPVFGKNRITFGNGNIFSSSKFSFNNSNDSVVTHIENNYSQVSNIFTVKSEGIVNMMPEHGLEHRFSGIKSSIITGFDRQPNAFKATNIAISGSVKTRHTSNVGVAGEVENIFIGNVNEYTNNIGGYFSAYNTDESQFSHNNFGVYASARFGNKSVGGKFEATGSVKNSGGIFYAGSGQTNYGVYSSAYGENQSSINYGIHSESLGGEECYGIYATATNGSHINYGIYAKASPSTPSGPNFAGYFDGNIFILGSYGPSDIMLKENIIPITNSISIVNQLFPKKFTFKTSQFPQMNLPEGNQFGLIAQDVEQILPELVKSVIQPAVLDSLGNEITPATTFKSLKYEAFIPILIQAVQEINTKNDSAILVLNIRIDSLENVISTFENRFNELSERIEECCKNGNGNGNGNNKNNGGNQKIATPTITQVDLVYTDAIVLEQNVPNPFAESTSINYYIPENVTYAQLIFTNNFGKIIKTVDITTSGYGTVMVYASNLSSGTYNYSLIVDGNVVETKKMVCVK